MRPMRTIARAVAEITPERLDQRIPDANADAEFQHLIGLLNPMLDRLQAGLTQARRFSADAAHELKTPLAILQAEIEQALQKATDDSTQQRTFAGLQEEVQRIRGIVRRLLLLAQADAGRLPLNIAEVDLAAMVREAAEDAALLAPDRDVSVTAPQDCLIEADAGLLRQAIDNLISNAVKFGDPGTPIQLELGGDEKGVRIRVTNQAEPIPAEKQEQIFERFGRGDPAHSRTIDGVGLGLNLSREIVRAHGGNLILAHNQNRTICFEIHLHQGPRPVAGRHGRTQCLHR